ncbi:MAG TPA: hypothetical protein VG847_09765, partial [Chitinophagaceae bacterium]|nr:hypothetical protein [Chitinophagaceae bacterium]
MTITIIITLCSLLLVAYVFDLTSSVTKIPPVLLLLLLGWIVREISEFMHINIPDLTGLLPFFGTLGLILIVLEGTLELELNRTKRKLILQSFLAALLPMISLSFLLAALLGYYANIPFKQALENAIPLCVISSSVAISSVKNLNAPDKEFIIYESSLSDIMGVLFFNFVSLNRVINLQSTGQFTLQLLIIAVISFIATIGLSYLLSKIEHHIKFIPIILLIILIYAISEIYHLPALIFILIFGLCLGNLDELKRSKWIQKLRPKELDKDVEKFKELTIEATFLIRTLFFLLFGYLMKKSEILNSETILFAIGISAGIFLIRAIMLKLLKLQLLPLLFIAPRGLINILLFLAIVPSEETSIVNASLITQVIIIMAITMMLGLMMTG